MIRKAREMTLSESQMARVLQTFSQALLGMSRFLSQAFGSLRLSEHGNFSVTARQLEDGRVVVNIISDPSLPLRLSQEFIINPDGSHSCTPFEMWRSLLAPPQATPRNRTGNRPLP